MSITSKCNALLFVTILLCGACQDRAPTPVTAPAKTKTADLDSDATADKAADDLSSSASTTSIDNSASTSSGTISNGTMSPFGNTASTQPTTSSASPVGPMLLMGGLSALMNVSQQCAGGACENGEAMPLVLQSFAGPLQQMMMGQSGAGGGLTTGLGALGGMAAGGAY